MWLNFLSHKDDCVGHRSILHCFKINLWVFFVIFIWCICICLGFGLQPQIFQSSFVSLLQEIVSKCTLYKCTSIHCSIFPLEYLGEERVKFRSNILFIYLLYFFLLKDRLSITKFRDLKSWCVPVRRKMENTSWSKKSE